MQRVEIVVGGGSKTVGVRGSSWRDRRIRDIEKIMFDFEEGDEFGLLMAGGEAVDLEFS